jgi:phosphohistidine phosphatase
MELYIFRHGEAGKRSSAPSKDFERPLTFSGRKEIEEISKVIDSLQEEITRIVTSPLRRTEETASVVARELKIPKVEKWDELKPEGNREEFYSKLSKLKRDSSILVVGHEPYLSSMVSEIISGSSGARISLKKGGVVKVRIDRFTPRPSGELRWLLTPRLIKKMS